MANITADKVTCVIPHAGAQQYLKEAVCSAVLQRFREVIIVNDGCPAVQLAALESEPTIRIIHLDTPVGCGNARNVGIRACNTPYVVMLDHDDVFCDGYFEAIAAWITRHDLRCAGATLRYIGERSNRVGAPVLRNPMSVLPSGFLSEISLVDEVGYFPNSLSEDLLFFRSIRRTTTLSKCPGARVLYRIHPQAESTRNAAATWAFNQLLPLYEHGGRSLNEVNIMAREFAASGTVPPELRTLFTGKDNVRVRTLSRSAYACWLNRDFAGMTRYSANLLEYFPNLLNLARNKWLR
jgi:glycosyltransferase involved in cell wall biosynthesis